MALEWTVEVRNPSLARVGQLSEHDLSDFLYVPRANNLGTWSVKLPDTVLNERGVRIPHALCAALRTQDAGLILTSPSGQVFSGPMIQATQEQSTTEPNGLWTIEGVSDLVEVAQVLSYPQPSNSNVGTQSVSNDVRIAKGEALLRAFVDVNIGPSASAARKVPALTLAPDLGRGPILTKSPRFQNLLELCQEIGTGASLCFDVVQVDSALQFQVSSQQDVSATVRWDIENNQLSSAKYGFSKPGLTRAIVAGQGEGTERTIIEVTTPLSLASEAVWGRIERFIDQRQTNDTAELTQAGLEALADEGSVVTSLQVVPSSAMAAGFGVSWFLGSFVTVVVGGQEIKAQVTEVPISITSAGVLVGAVVGDPTGFDWESVLAAKQSRTESRVSALERTAEAASLANFYTRDQLALVVSPPVCHVLSSAAQVTSATSAVFTTVTWNTAAFDTHGIHSGSRLTVPAAGFYRVLASATFAPAAGSVAIQFAVNGVARLETQTWVASATGAYTEPMTSSMLQLTVGQYVEVQVAAVATSQAIFEFRGYFELQFIRS